MDARMRPVSDGRRRTIRRATGGLLAAAFLGGLVVAPAGAQDSGVDLEAWKKLLFVDGEYYQDPNYVGYNAGGTMGLMNLGNWPEEPLPWLSITSPETGDDGVHDLQQRLAAASRVWRTIRPGRRGMLRRRRDHVRERARRGQGPPERRAPGPAGRQVRQQPADLPRTSTTRSSISTTRTASSTPSMPSRRRRRRRPSSPWTTTRPGSSSGNGSAPTPRTTGTGRSTSSSRSATRRPGRR